MTYDGSRETGEGQIDMFTCYTVNKEIPAEKLKEWK